VGAAEGETGVLRIRVPRASSPIVSIMMIAACAACSTSSSNATTADASSGADGGGADSSNVDGAAQDSASSYDASAIVAARPYTLHVPTGLDTTTAAPLVVMFHGFGISGATEESVLRLVPTSDAHGFLYAFGEGTTDRDGNQFWNATGGCCNIYGSNVDDVTYFDAIVDDVASKYKVDKKRVYVVGHSNGAFMAHRLACERASRIAGIVALAGENYLDPTMCKPTEHVSILEVHGDADQTILYGGGSKADGAYPSCHASVASWAANDACTGALAPTGVTLDLDTNLAANETIVETYGGCPAGIDVALWTIQGGAHVPAFNRPEWGNDIWGFSSAHAKP
jgi:polyhydroxybutyrate depolymerase